MKAWGWMIIAILGIAMMVGAYASRDRLDPQAPWASGLLAIGPASDVEAKPPAGAIPVRVRLLSSSDVAEMVLFVSGDLAPDKALGAKGQVRAKLVQTPLANLGLGTEWLRSGRLPEAGRNEILAGARLEPRDALIVGGTTLTVVGVLKPDVGLLASSYLIPPAEANTKLFPVEVPTVLDGWFVHASPAELRDEKTRKSLETAFPSTKYGWVVAVDRLEPRTFYLYLAGLAILLLGGSGSLIRLYCGLADWLAPRAPIASSAPEVPAGAEVSAGKASPSFLAGPLLEIRARPRLIWGVHIVYFGLVIAGSLLVYRFADVQAILLGNVQKLLSTGNNPLGVAGEAYRSGNIPRAALVTFVVNFFLGSLAYLTMTSIVLPGSAIFFASLRALMWGLLLAPTMETLAYQMLPHSLTMVLEGEGYILAAFFGLLIPIHIFQSSLGGNPLTRFGRAILLNFKAQFWIALVLIVAAVYEATEVILMNR
jgi:hypothetical protein